MTPITPSNMVTSPNGLTLIAALGLLVLVVRPVAVPLATVAVAVAGMAESLASWVYFAVRPVTFVQTEGGLPELATKETAAHCTAG